MMKHTITRLLALVLAVLLVFALAACGKKEAASKPADDEDAPLVREETKEESSSGTAAAEPAKEEELDLASVFSGNGETDIIYGKLDAASRQEIIDSAKKDGYDVSFEADGTMVVKDKDGTTFQQNPDGSWQSVDADGTQSQLGGNWPDNEFTRVLPVPEIPLVGASTQDGEFTALFSTSDVNDIKAYAEKVKAKGFTIDPEEEEQNVMGMTIYTYKASNSDGYEVEVTFAVGTSGIIVRKQ